MGFFAGLFGTMFEFYGGMFRLTFFLPFTLLQAWQISRQRFIEELQEKAASVELNDEGQIQSDEKTLKISWNKNAQPSHSILKKQVDWDETYKRKNDPNSDITNQLNEIGRSLEKLSTILLKEKNECSLESLDINTDEDHQTSSTPVSIPPNKKVQSNPIESKDDSNVQRGRTTVIIQHQDRSRSLDSELQERSVSFQELKELFKEKKQVIKHRTLCRGRKRISEA